LLPSGGRNRSVDLSNGLGAIFRFDTTTVSRKPPREIGRALLVRFSVTFRIDFVHRSIDLATDQAHLDKDVS
jgi:hypothetical protein